MIYENAGVCVFPSQEDAEELKNLIMVIEHKQIEGVERGSGADYYSFVVEIIRYDDDSIYFRPKGACHRSTRAVVRWAVW